MIASNLAFTKRNKFQPVKQQVLIPTTPAVLTTANIAHHSGYAILTTVEAIPAYFTAGGSVTITGSNSFNGKHNIRVVGRNTKEIIIPLDPIDPFKQKASQSATITLNGVADHHIYLEGVEKRNNNGDVIEVEYALGGKYLIDLQGVNDEYSHFAQVTNYDSTTNVDIMQSLNGLSWVLLSTISVSAGASSIIPLNSYKGTYIMLDVNSDTKHSVCFV